MGDFLPSSCIKRLTTVITPMTNYARHVLIVEWPRRSNRAGPHQDTVYQNNIRPRGLAPPSKINERHARGPGVRGVVVGIGVSDGSTGANPDSPRLWWQLHHCPQLPGVRVWCVLRRKWGMACRNVTAKVSPEALLYRFGPVPVGTHPELPNVPTGCEPALGFCTNYLGCLWERFVRLETVLPPAAGNRDINQFELSGDILVRFPPAGISCFMPALSWTTLFSISNACGYCDWPDKR